MTISHRWPRRVKCLDVCLGLILTWTFALLPTCCVASSHYLKYQAPAAYLYDQDRNNYDVRECCKRLFIPEYCLKMCDGETESFAERQICRGAYETSRKLCFKDPNQPNLIPENPDSYSQLNPAISSNYDDWFVRDDSKDSPGETDQQPEPREVNSGDQVSGFSDSMKSCSMKSSGARSAFVITASFSWTYCMLNT